MGKAWVVLAVNLAREDGMEDKGEREYGGEERTERMTLPMPRDLKLPEGCRLSNFRKIRLEKGLESANLLQECLCGLSREMVVFSGARWIFHAL